MTTHAIDGTRPVTMCGRSLARATGEMWRTAQAKHPRVLEFTESDYDPVVVGLSPDVDCPACILSSRNQEDER